MSFSAPGDGGSAAGNHGAGDVATQVFGSSGGPAQQEGSIPQAGPNPAPAMAPMSLGNENQPDYSGIIAQNAKPPEGSGGLSTLLKLIGI